MPEGARGATALVGGTLIDGNGGAPLRDAVVVAADGRFAAVGGPCTEIPRDAERIDCTGKFVLPGLIDAHVHVTSSSGGQASKAEYAPETRAAKMRSWLGFGVTTIFDMGSNPHFDALKADLESGKVLGPRMYGVKYAITSPGGHPTGLGRELRLADRDTNLFEVATPEEARAAVREAAAGQPDGLKIHHTRSQFPGTSCLDCDLEKHAPDTLRALVDEGHKQGLRVFAHIAWPSECREVVEAGVDALAHTITHAETGAQPVIDLMAERGLFMHTTLTRIEAYFVLKLDPFLVDKLRGKVPDAVLDSLALPNSVARFRNESDAIEGDARRIFQVATANLRRAHKAGMRIVLGTDSGGPGGLHGAVVPREMELMHAAGMTPMQVIEAATREAAACIGRAKELGTIEPGKRADAVVLDADPLRDLANMRRVALTMKDGRAMTAAELRVG